MSFIDQFNNLTGSSDELARRFARIGPPMITLILVALLAWQLVGLTWLLVPRVKPEAQALTATTSPVPHEQRVANTGDTRVDMIVSAHLLGIHKPPEVGEKKIIADDVKDTPLKNLSLKGTVAAGDEEHAYAIIELDGQQVVYAVGDEVTNGRKLHAVEAHRVLLSYSGALEELKLPKLSDTGGNPSVRGSTRTTSRRGTSAQRQIARSIAANPAKLSDLIRPQPVFSDGKQLGYRVYPGRKRNQFTSLGLKPGDLVTEINGTPLDDPARGLEIFRSMNDTSQVSVTVERNGTPTTLVLDTSKLDLSGDGTKR